MKYGWSLQLSKWQELRRKVHECDWKRVSLDSGYGFWVPESSGVYLICTNLNGVPVKGGVMDRLYNAIYAGRSTDLRRRFREHAAVRRYPHRNPSLRDAIFTFDKLDFWYSECNSTHMADIERVLIDALGPPANRKRVRGKIGNAVPAGRRTGG